MIDLNLRLPYSKIPHDTLPTHSIYPLSDDGLKQYISKDHFTHHYLNKFNPEILAMLDPYAEEKEKLYQLTVQQAKNKSKTKVDFQSSADRKSEDKEISKVQANINSNNAYVKKETSDNKNSFNIQQYLTKSQKFAKQSKKIGFSPSEIPRLENSSAMQANHTSQATRMNNNLLKTISSGKVIKDTDKNDILQVCEKENEKFRSTLMSRSNQKSSRLKPRISGGK